MQPVHISFKDEETKEKLLSDKKFVNAMNNLIEKASEVSGITKFILNGEEIYYHTKTLTYVKICKMAGLEWKNCPTITIHEKGTNKSYTIKRGESATITKNTIINCRII